MFAVTVNVPGFLPESEPFRTRDAEAAAMAWRSEVRHTLDNLENDETFLQWDTQLHTLSNAEAAQGISWVIDGYAHNLEIVPAEIIAELWVCSDCRMSREIGETSPGVDPAHLPWSVLPEADVTNWEYEEESAEAAEEGSGFRTFDSAPCDGCGSRLAGERFRYAQWG